jgi:glycosyltransferase involved in cell wall biosynthesis
MSVNRRVALVYPVPLSPGGLAVQSANVVAALLDPRVDLVAVGPGVIAWPRRAPRREPAWCEVRVARPRWSSWRWLRSFTGAAQWTYDVRLGRAAAKRLDRLRPEAVYAFTQVGLESLEWARAHRIPTILESPNGHIRHFRSIYVNEHDAWCQGAYRGHPSPDMVQRVEQEYTLADRIRVSSEWARESLTAGGVAPGKISVLQQPVDLETYQPPASRAAGDGPLRVVFVGTLDLRKGFVYLLDAVRATGRAVSLDIVGATVDRCTRQLLAAHSDGLDVTVRSGDPRPAYHRAELAVVPSLEDGSPFAAAEAMSCGLTLVTTDCCGAREWVQPGVTGWVVEGRSADAIARALDEALAGRDRLAAMGAAARRATEARADAARCDVALADWVLGSIPTPA